VSLCPCVPRYPWKLLLSCSCLSALRQRKKLQARQNHRRLLSVFPRDCRVVRRAGPGGRRGKKNAGRCEGKKKGPLRWSTKQEHKQTHTESVAAHCSPSHSRSSFCRPRVRPCAVRWPEQPPRRRLVATGGQAERQLRDLLTVVPLTPHTHRCEDTTGARKCSARCVSLCCCRFGACVCPPLWVSLAGSNKTEDARGACNERQPLCNKHKKRRKQRREMRKSAITYIESSVATILQCLQPRIVKNDGCRRKELCDAVLHDCGDVGRHPDYHACDIR
jgi:hypothetical protein